MWKGLFCAGALLALVPAVAGAQGIDPKDRRVVVEDEKVAAALKQTVDKPAIPEATVRAIGPILYADNKLTPNESDLILELLGSKTGKVTITTPAGEHFDVPVLSPGA